MNRNDGIPDPASGEVGPGAGLWDVAVIGGGPAGSTSAAFLARAGARVVVFERETFPRFHIGESLLPYNIPLFAELGVLDAIKEAGFMRKFGARFGSADGAIESSVRFANGLFTDQPMAFQVERAKFDDILLRHAESCGATVRENTRVTSHAVDPEGVTVTTDDGVGHRAKFLIDASGQDNFTGTRERVRQFSPRLKKIAVFGHFDAGEELADTPESGDIVIYRLRDAWFWAIPLSRTKLSLGLVVDRTGLESARPADLFARAVEGNTALRERFGTCQPCGPLRQMRDFSYTNRSLAGPRLLRVGDAAGFLDPIFSSGVFLAMKSGKLAAEAAGEALANGAAWIPSMRGYERKMRKMMRVYQHMIEGFYTRPFFDLLVHPHDSWKIPAAINAVLAGRLDEHRGIRWRMRLFHALVRVQSVVPLVPRTKLSPL